MERESIEVEIRQLIERWAAAVRAADMEAILAGHAPDMRLFDVPPPLQARGLDPYRESWQMFFPWYQNSGVFAISELEIAAGADVAFSHCLVRCAGTEPDGRKSECVVRLTTGYRKLDGRWQITHEHHSVPAEPNQAAV